MKDNKHDTRERNMQPHSLRFLQTLKFMGIEKLDPERYLHFAVNRVSRKGRDRDSLIKAMRIYADLRIDEFLEAQRRDAEGADI
jgi:hypothetical protein